MKMRTYKLILVAACAALVLSGTAVHAETIESWENGLDGWIVPPGFNAQAGSTAFNPTQGFTNGVGVTDGATAITVTGAGPGGPNYGQLFAGPASPATPVNPGDPPTLAQMLSIAQSVSFDVYTPPGSFGFFLQFDVDVNNNDTGFVSLDGFSYPGTTIGQQTTITVPVTPALRAALAASTNTTTMDIQVGGGFTSGNETFTLDNIRTVVATTPSTYTWSKDVSGTWVTNPIPLATAIATSNWDLAATPNQAGATAVFGPVITANRTVTLDGVQTVGHVVFNNANAAYNIAPGNSGSLTIDNSSVDLGRGNFTTPSGSPDITVMAGNHTISAPITLANGVTVLPAAGTSLTISGGIGGNGPLTVADSGKLILTTPTTYTGNTNVNAGTLQIAGLSGAGSAIVGSGGTLAGSGSINGSLSVLSGGAVDMRTLPGSVDTLSPSGLTINAGSSFGFDIGSTADSIANSGSYAFSGTGTAAISLGLINGFHAGDFTLISNATGISLSQFTLPSNAIDGFASTLQLSGNNLQVHLVATAPLTAFWRGGRVAGSPSVWTATNGSTNWDTSQTSNVDSGLPSTPTSVVFAANAGTAANMANTTLGADLRINSLEIQTANPVGIGGSNTLTVNNGITIDSGAGTTTISSNVKLGLEQTWTNNSTNKMTVSGAVSGNSTSALNVSGSGRIRLTGNNTYTGGTTLTSGTLEVGSNHGLGPDGSNVAQNGGTIEIDPGVSPAWSLTGSQGSQTIKALAGIDPTLTIQTVGAQHTYGGSIQNGTGTISVVVSGTGLQILTNANTYTGGTTINPGATLQLGDGAGNSGSIAGNVTTNGTLTFAGDGTTSPGTGDQIFGGNIDGSGGVTSINAGTVTLNGNNSYTGTTTISAGKLVTGSATALGNANLTIGAGATLDVNGKSLTVKAL
ncbi:MAG TPA: autotransporter-associated beta strand repeat-containing protein, partial [Pirellulales bacterium]